MAKRRALNGNVIVEEIKEAEKKTASGIIIPDTKRKVKLLKGVVKLAEAGAPLKKGEIVYFKQGVGYDCPLDDKDYLLIKINDLSLVEEA